MKQLKAVNKYLIKYKWRLLIGLLFITLSNIFAVIPPMLIRNILDDVGSQMQTYNLISPFHQDDFGKYIMQMVMIGGIAILVCALLKGLFMFCMRQTIIVMSRHIEYDQKNEIYQHYQSLPTSFFKKYPTGDLMSRISEDVSRVRMYTGPAIMYITNLIVLIIMCFYNMFSQNWILSLYVIAPMPVLAITIFYVNKIIHRKSEKIQIQLSNITAVAQQSYAGIRVVKSYAQESDAVRKFAIAANEYKESTINLAKTEAFYFPAMNFFIGISILFTVLIGGYQVYNGQATAGNIAEFVMYITMLMFPISAIGLTANMIQRAAVSQSRINEFLNQKTNIINTPDAIQKPLTGDIEFKSVNFTYPHTGIHAIKNFSLHIKAGEKIAVIGKTGSGKSTLAHLLLRMYEADSGNIYIDNVCIKQWDLKSLRNQMSYVPQELLLFSDTIANNISFGYEKDEDLPTQIEIEEAAELAAVDHDIMDLPQQYQTVIGERGVMLSGGQKQRITIARALIKHPKMVVLDESLSAVDNKTEKAILNNFNHYLKESTCIIITHRIFKDIHFDKILIMEDGSIAEQGNHKELMNLNGYYASLYKYQIQDQNQERNH